MGCSLIYGITLPHRAASAYATDTDDITEPGDITEPEILSKSFRTLSGSGDVNDVDVEFRAGT